MNYININVNVVDQNSKATLNENMIESPMRKITQKEKASLQLFLCIIS